MARIFALGPLAPDPPKCSRSHPPWEPSFGLSSAVLMMRSFFVGAAGTGCSPRPDDAAAAFLTCPAGRVLRQRRHGGRRGCRRHHCSS
jgi:hypothetical protein